MEQPNISIIVAIAQNYAIGKDNDLLWHISDDLKRFKAITSSHTVIMGSKTYMSLPRRPLPNRRNIVLTGNPDFQCQGAELAHSVQQVLDMVKDDGECFVIGGGTVYNQFLPHAIRLYVTLVHKDFDADVFFPAINNEQFIVEKESERKFDPSSQLEYTYIDYIRKL